MLHRTHDRGVMSPAPVPPSRGPSLKVRLVILAASLLAVLGGCVADRVGASRALARDAIPYSVEPRSTRARLLVIGDGMAAGTGASQATASVAGLLSARSPGLAIDNLAQSGARFRDLPAQLDAAQGKRYDAIIVMAGAHDVLWLTGERTLREDIDRVALRAKAMAPLVVIMPASDMSRASFLLPPLTWFIENREAMLHRVARDEAALRGMSYVNLDRGPDDDALAALPDNLRAADGVHPSDLGYARWLHELLAQSPLATVLEMGHVSGVPVLSGGREPT